MPSSQTEIELKLQIPDAARRAVTAAMARGASQQTRLQAVYFDTPDRRLAARGVALRLRLEGNHWVQTLKAGDPHAMTRHEHNVALPDAAADQEPSVDLSRHDGTRAAELLEQALGKDGGDALQALYRTNIERTHRYSKTRHGRVELALDLGEIVSGELRWPVCELEVELIAGKPQAVIDVAQQWIERHGLWLDTRSKAERGDRLSRGSRRGALRPLKPVVLDPSAGADPAWRQLLQSVLATVLPSLADVASNDHTPEQLDALRDGLVRLLHTRALFKDLIDGPEQEAFDAVKAANEDLAPAHEQQAMAARWGEALSDAGAPDLGPLPVPQAAQLSTVASRPALSHALLLLQAWCLRPASERPEAEPPLRKAMAKTLRHWHRKLQKKARPVPPLVPEALQPGEEAIRVQRQVARLRDGLTLTASLFKPNSTATHLDRLNRAHEALEAWSLLQQAQHRCRAVVEQDPRAWFAIGWLAAQAPRLQSRANKALKALAQQPRLKPRKAGKSD